MSNLREHREWDLIINPRTRWFEIGLADLWRYRDLLMLLVQRDFKATYKQTILGPVWLIIQPILTSLTFTIIFGTIAGISTDGVPKILFYLAGITLWTYFADCLTKTSTTFTANANIFGKVYFPRLIIPLSILVSNLIKLGVQFAIFISVWLYFMFSEQQLQPHWEVLWVLPVLIVIMAGLGLGAGIMISSLTTKYRDMTFLVGFGVQLLIYASSIVLPISGMSARTQEIMLMNPIVPIIEAFKYIFLGKGYFSFASLGYSALFMLLQLIIAVVVFSRVEKSFMDTV